MQQKCFGLLSVPISSLWVFGSLCAFVSIAPSLSQGLLGIICMAYFLYWVWLIPTSRHLSSKHLPHCDYQWALLNEQILLRLDLYNACCTIQDYTCPHDPDQEITHLCRVKLIHFFAKETRLLQ